MEKKKRHYSLETIKKAFSTVAGLRVTESGLKFAVLELGLTMEGLVELVQSVEGKHFYKSMTSKADHRVWQDVYHLPFDARLLYVKFTIDSEGYLLISLKEK